MHFGDERVEEVKFCWINVDIVSRGLSDDSEFPHGLKKWCLPIPQNRIYALSHNCSEVRHREFHFLEQKWAGQVAYTLWCSTQLLQILLILGYLVTKISSCTGLYIPQQCLQVQWSCAEHRRALRRILKPYDHLSCGKGCLRCWRSDPCKERYTIQSWGILTTGMVTKCSTSGDVLPRGHVSFETADLVDEPSGIGQKLDFHVIYRPHGLVNLDEWSWIFFVKTPDHSQH